VGCHAVVDRSIHKVSAAPAPAAVWLVHYRAPYPSYTPPPQYPIYAAPPPGKRELICAVQALPPPPPPAARPPAAPPAT
jgi:hypothetical protein